jgi:hypothetical protein
MQTTLMQVSLNVTISPSFAEFNTASTHLKTHVFYVTKEGAPSDFNSNFASHAKMYISTLQTITNAKLLKLCAQVNFQTMKFSPAMMKTKQQCLLTPSMENPGKK